ncbi:cell division protein SepF [Candidatus Woesearchaeota archaeon]|nr:cell division protein SepF [Candidatus Woesearchaeota archaeon]
MPNVITKFLDKITGVEEESSSSYADEEYVTVDLNEQQMKQLETVKTGAQITVKVHKLKADSEYQTVLDFVRNNNIVILDISLLKASDFTGLKMLSGKLKQKCAEMGWGLGALSNDLLMVTPTSVKFEKKKQEEALVEKM